MVRGYFVCIRFSSRLGSRLISQTSTILLKFCHQLFVGDVFTTLKLRLPLINTVRKLFHGIWWQVWSMHAPNLIFLSESQLFDED